ncbi:probable GTP diphosphokinase CRSH, chloroplastic [Nymphaea colorata]|nr:probable GTP diphosphokinase CRSH, chloroplastic [Nymphaea colorata]
MESSPSPFLSTPSEFISWRKVRHPLPHLCPPMLYCRSRYGRKLPTACCTNLGPVAAGKTSIVEQPGGRMVVELVGAFNDLTEKFPVLSTSSSRLLFKTLKRSIPLLLELPVAADGRPPLSRALSVACILADLQMDAEVISASTLRELVEAGVITLESVKNQIGTGIAHLLHECLRVRDTPSRIDNIDDDNGTMLMKYCLTYYDIRAIILELAFRLDKMRHLDCLPRHQQQIQSLQIITIYAPMAHAVGINALSLELEDLSFRYLFPRSYTYLDRWLRSHETGGRPLIDVYKEQLLQALQDDHVLKCLVEDISVHGRFKSRFSTMKKLLKDGRQREEVNDLLGLRVILKPKSDGDALERGKVACYRAREVIQALWREIPHRMKDYIAKPKANGYQSLHMAVDVSDAGQHKPLVEIQIRTTEMDAQAVDGSASHSLYKGGLTNPEEAKRLKAIMMAAAELAALRLDDHPPGQMSGISGDQKNHVFHLLDKNEDGRISSEELKEVMEELGADREDAMELMQLIDANNDGSLSSDEFELFQRQVRSMRRLEANGDPSRSLLGEKLHTAEVNG